MVLRMVSPTKNKHGIFQVRVRVPNELISIVGKTQIKKSLRTKDAHEAKLRFPEVYASIQSDLEVARRKLSSDTRLTDTIISQIIYQWKNQVAKSISGGETASYLMKWGGLIEENHEPVVLLLESIEEGKDRYGKLNEILLPMVELQLVRFEIEANVDSTQYQKFLIEFAKAYIQITQLALTIETGSLQLKKVGVERAQPSLTQESITVAEVWDRYKEAIQRREPDKAESRIRDYTSGMSKFLSFCGGDDIHRIDRRKISTFRSLLDQLPTKPKKDVKALSLEQQVSWADRNDAARISQRTVKTQIQHVSAVFSFARKEGIIDNQPVEGSVSDIRIVSNAEERPYQDAELSQIFSSKIFTEGYRPPVANYGDAPFWIPIILYYTGARAEEIAQLYVDDISIENDIPYIHIRARRSDQSVKTGNSRKVPIHPHLVELGFLQYLSHLPSSGRVFPFLAKNPKYHAKVGNWFSSFIKEIGINRGEIKPFHSFRHTFITKCRELAVREDVQDAITGHSGGNVSRQYGRFPLPTLYELILQIPRINVG